MEIYIWSNNSICNFVMWPQAYIDRCVFEGKANASLTLGYAYLIYWTILVNWFKSELQAFWRRIYHSTFKVTHICIYLYTRISKYICFWSVIQAYLVVPKRPEIPLYGRGNYGLFSLWFFQREFSSDIVRFVRRIQALGWTGQIIESFLERGGFECLLDYSERFIGSGSVVVVHSPFLFLQKTLFILLTLFSPFFICPIHPGPAQTLKWSLIATRWSTWLASSNSKCRGPFMMPGPRLVYHTAPV